MKDFEVGDEVVLNKDYYVEGDEIYGYSIKGVVISDHSGQGSLLVEWEGAQASWYYSKNKLGYYDKDITKIEDIGSVYQTPTTSGKIKSDGKSSSYYDLKISKQLLQKFIERSESDTCYVKVEELINELFGNDFDFGTLFKSTVRGYLQTKGEGKAGNDLEYEMNKVVYYAEKIGGK